MPIDQDDANMRPEATLNQQQWNAFKVTVRRNSAIAERISWISTIVVASCLIGAGMFFLQGIGLISIAIYAPLVAWLTKHQSETLMYRLLRDGQGDNLRRSFRQQLRIGVSSAQLRALAIRGVVVANNVRLEVADHEGTTHVFAIALERGQSSVWEQHFGNGGVGGSMG